MNKLIGFIILVGSLLLAWAWMEYQGFRTTPLKLAEESIIFEVPRGATL